MEILAIHPGALGDVILFGQFLQGLGGCVRLVAGREKGRLLHGLGVVAAASDFESLPMHELFRSADPEPNQMAGLKDRLGHCDCLISCFAGDAPAARLRLIEITQAARAHFLPIRPPSNFPGHLVECWAQQVNVPFAPPPHWQVPRTWQALAREQISRAGVAPGRKLFVIHPGAGAGSKCWPMDRFAELSRGLAQRHAVLWLVGPTELDWWGPEKIAALAGDAPLLSCPPVEVLAGVLAQCAGFVGNDSGPSHLAAAIGAKTVAIFGPTSPIHFAPRGQNVRVISAERLENIAVEPVFDSLIA